MRIGIINQKLQTTERKYRMQRFENEIKKTTADRGKLSENKEFKRKDKLHLKKIKSLKVYNVVADCHAFKLLLSK